MIHLPGRILVAVHLAFFLWLPVCAHAAATALEGPVTWVYDGDTLEVGGAGKVRLLGIDTPEREPSERDRFFNRWKVPPERLRKISSEARSFAIGAAKGKRVRILLEGENRDRHGRLLAYVILPDGRTLNRLLLEKGYAVVYRRFDFERKEEFLEAEEEARSRRRGLWK